MIKVIQVYETSCKWCWDPLKMEIIRCINLFENARKLIEYYLTDVSSKQLIGRFFYQLKIELLSYKTSIEIKVCNHLWS